MTGVWLRRLMWTKRKVSFDGLWKDRYVVSVSLAGYEKISVAADISATDNLVLDTIVLKRNHS